MNQSTAQSDPQPPPSLAEKAWNLAAAIAGFVADGCQTVGHAEYAQRLRICDTCEQREAAICKQCGCYIPLKAQGRAMQCPLGRWPVSAPQT